MHTKHGYSPELLDQLGLRVGVCFDSESTHFPSYGGEGPLNDVESQQWLHMTSSFGGVI